MFTESDAPSWVWKGTVPSLNGLRALAILGVIASHYNRDFEGSWVIGHFGVTSFFVLSGFLITLLLLRERRRTGIISLSAFYQRRALRILPAYLTFLLVMGILAAFGIIAPSRLTWITALTYTSCFATMAIDPHLAHSWSLSVEEHFYFLWPLLFRWARPKAAILTLIAVVAMSPVLRYVLYELQIPALDINYSTPGQMGNIAVGCLIAFIVTGQFMTPVRTHLQRVPVGFILLGMSAILLSVVTLRSHKTMHHVLADPIRSLGFGVILLGVLYLREGHLIRRLLNWAPMNGIGILSYSLYLWQQIFARGYRDMPGGIPGSLVLLLLAACASYFLIESPFLKLKEKLAEAKKPPASLSLGTLMNAAVPIDRVVQ